MTEEEKDAIIKEWNAAWTLVIGGAPSDLWGATWTKEDIDSATFGIDVTLSASNE